MSYQLDTLNKLKHKLEQTTLPADQKYQYLRGILDFIESEREPINKPFPVKSESKPLSTVVIPTKIIKKDEAKKQPKPLIPENLKAIILTTLAMCGKDCWMDTVELLKYNNMNSVYGCNEYQKMNIALRQLTEAKKILRQRKGFTKAFEYCLPSHEGTRIITNGEIAQQQRKV